MTRSQKILFISLSVFSLMVISWALNRGLTLERSCLRFHGIESIELNGQKVYNCEWVSRLERSEASGEIQGLVARINQLSNLNPLFPNFTSLRVVIDRRRPFTYERSYGILKLGETLALEPGQMERAVLLEGMARSRHGLNSLQSEVLADLMTWTALGDARWVDPTTREIVDPAERISLMSIPRTLAQYCNDSFRSIRHLMYCSMGYVSGEPVDPEWSLRPLLSWSLWQAIQDLPTGDKIHFYRHVFSIKSSLPAKRSPVQTRAERIAWLKSHVKTYLSSWGLWSPAEETRLHRLYTKLNFGPPRPFDLSIQVGDAALAPRVIASLSKWMRWSAGSPKRVLVVFGRTELVLPRGQFVHLDAKDIVTRRHLILGCHWPTIREAIKIKSHLLLAIHLCGEDKLPSWHKVFSSSDHTMAVHIPSLRDWVHENISRRRLLAKPVTILAAHQADFQGLPVLAPWSISE